MSRLAECGTQRAYLRHLRNGEDTCGRCRQANNDKKRRLMSGKKKREDYLVQYKPRGLEWMYTPSEWTQQARCAGEEPELWFSVIPSEQARAVEICQECPVQAACLSEALASNAEGIWGGLTEDEIRSLKRRRRRA